MPSRSNKSSSNCCGRRTPPSPDSEPPRPAVSPNKISHRPVKDIVSSGSTNQSEAIELRPIFEENKEPDTEFGHIKQNSSSRLRSLLRSDKSDNEDEWDQIKTKKSSTAINAVKQKLKKHLSRESALGKHRSISSVGTTEEEIERRAELRRIRHKRIQEELSNEAGYDEDANSVSSIVVGDTSFAQTILSSWVLGEALPLPRIDNVSIPYSALPFPELAPLEEQPDSDEENGVVLEGTIQATDPTTDLPSITRPSRTVKRRYSLPTLKDGEGRLQLEVYQTDRKRSSLAPIPSTPVLEPQRLPSIVEPAKSSWRLSFASSNRANSLRRLSEEYKIHIPTGLEPTGVSPSCMKKWLHGQGMRSSSNVMLSSEDSSNLKASETHPSCAPEQDLAGVDGGTSPSSSTVHLHEMGISKRLASRVLMSSCSSPQLTSWGSHNRVGSSMSNTSRNMRDERDRFLRNTSDSVPLSEQIPGSWGAKVPHSSSSFYPSNGNSIQPSPESSRFNLASLLMGNKSKTSIASSQDLEFTRLETIIAVANTPPSDYLPGRPIPITRQHRRPTIDDSSLLVSETESFREREAELSIVKTRFASTEARRSPATPVSSKFREEFDLDTEGPDNPLSRKPSAFKRLAKAIRSYDGPSAEMEDLLSVPVPDFMPADPSKKKSVPNSSEGLGGGWATRSKDAPTNKDTTGSSVNDELLAKTVLGGLRLGKMMKPKTAELKLAAKERKEKLDEQLAATKELVMDSWEEEMAATAAKAKAKSKNIVKRNKPTGPDLRYPRTWARFASHTRHERSFSASQTDLVASKDFAVATGSENGDPIWYHHERKHHLYHHDGDEHPSHADDTRKKGIIERIHGIIKEEVQNYENAGEDPEIEDTFGRRSSLNVPLKLAFPELEILSMEIRTAAQQEQEVLEQIAEKNRLQALADTDMGTVDGSVDPGLEVPDEEENMSIADPKYYDDCLIGSDSDGSHLPSGKSSKKGKHRTWSGKDWDGYGKMGSGGRTKRRETAVRKSTDDYHFQLQRMEREERERVLRTVEEVWGRGSEKKTGLGPGKGLRSVQSVIV